MGHDRPPTVEPGARPWSNGGMAEFRRVTHGPQFHHLLLRVAGYASDDALTAAREALAEGRVEDVARAVGAAATAHGLAVSDEDFALLTATAPESVAELSTTGDQSEPAFEFQPALADPGLFGAGGPPPMLDLTDAPFPLVDALTDEADRAAIESMSRDPGAVALWRAWRFGATAEPARIFLLEADVAADDLPAVTAVFQRELVAGGLAEVFAPGTELPSYQAQARAASALLWTAADAAPVRIARAFDGVDPASGPWFAANHPRLSEDEAARVADLLDAGLAVLATTQRMDDVMEPARGQVVPMTYRTNGSWIWTDTVSYYLRTYGLAPDPDLLAELTASGPVDAVAEHRALSALFRPAESAAVWSA